MTQSVLDSIAGLGDVRRKKLLRHFGSVKRIREASLEDLYDVQGLPKGVAEAVYDAMHLGAEARESPHGDRRAAS
jgi:excinuclease ABC subunit C